MYICLSFEVSFGLIFSAAGIKPSIFFHALFGCDYSDFNLSFFVLELLETNVIVMELLEFVEQNLSSTLKIVERLKKIDNILNLHETALIYHYTDEGFEFINETLIKNKGIISTEYARFLAFTLQNNFFNNII